MDFVDLDKVLDQFEEEEKAAGELQPGQETTPSGYAEYLASHQDLPWEALSFADPSESASLKQLHGHLNSHSIAYDDPYDNFGVEQHPIVSRDGQDVFPRGKSADITSSLYAKNSIHSDYYSHHSHNGVGYNVTGSSQPLNEEEELSKVKLKQQMIEAYLPLQQKSNGFEYDQVIRSAETNGSLDTHSKGKGREEGERRGLIASQPASIQTDVLTPRSEQELWSGPFPKSDILVVGHEDNSSPRYTSRDRTDELTERKEVQNGTYIYAAASSIEHKNEDSVDSSVFPVHTDIGEPGAGEHDPSNTMESTTKESQRKQPGSDRAVMIQNFDEDVASIAESPDDVSVDLCERKVKPECDNVTENGADKQAATENSTVASENGTVGFDEEECEMDSDAIDAYLQDMDKQSDSGCEEGMNGETALSAEDAVDTSQNKFDQVSSQSVSTLNISNCHPAASTEEDMETQGECDPASGLTNRFVMDRNTPNVSQPQGGVPQVMDTDKEQESVSKPGDHPDTSDNNNCSAAGPDLVADTRLVTAASIHPQPKEQTQLMDVGDTSQGGFEPKQGATLSLDFPITGAGSELSTLMKGRLEIESLLDEAVAARLAQKHAESRVNINTPPGALHVPNTLTAPVVGSQPAESLSTVLDVSGVQDVGKDLGSSLPNTLGSSSSPTLGIGARPKDPSQMKKNRPNSLLGLSKISLGTPFSPPPQPADSLVAGQQQTMEEGGRPPFGMHSVDPVNNSDPQVRQFYSESRHLGAPPPVVSVPAPDSSAPAPGSVGAVQASDLEVPVMRRPDAGYAVDVGEGVEASAGGQRPRSWSPSSMASPQSQRMKRPTSLNLPVRQDLGHMGSVSPDGDGPRTRRAEVLQDMGEHEDTGSTEDDSMVVGDADGGSSGGTDSVEEEGAAAAVEMQLDNPPHSILHMNLGKVAPAWVPDADASACMECASRFTFTKRRHHCRACGKVFCSTCCNLKSRLAYQENKEGRVCIACHQLLATAESCGPAGNVCRSPNPNNPIEYCSTIPPPQQANARAPLPTVMVPTGVLKREGSNRKSEPKQVMFSDGIRPGGDLTELDGSDQARLPPRRTGRVQKKVERQQGDHASPKTRRLRGGEGIRNPCLIPEEGLPPVVVDTDEKGEVTLSENPDLASLMAQIRNEEASPVTFAVNHNLFVLVKIINLDCCVNRVVWCFTTRGMITVGQEELVMVLETLPDEDTIPRDIFCHFSTVYEEAGKGNTVSNMGHSIFNQQFLDSRGHGGMLYLRASFQCTMKLLLPNPPFLFTVLLQKWETPWAKVFPIRLMLRLGAEFRYYPCPLVSIRNRKPVFYEIGHTIMNLLADFRNFQYMLPQIRGVTIHMEDKKTYINLPRNRYDDLMKVVSDSNEHVMAMGASFSTDADSHLVCIQNEEGNYQTQAINIQNKPRQVTGASFVVFNGALKSSSGLHAKSSIVEDGLMVQIMPDMMAALKQAMKDMVDFTIGCGSVTIAQPEEMVVVRWVGDDKQVNVGVKSPVDGMSMEGVESIHVHNATDYVGENFAIRWTEVFFLQTESGSSRWEPVDLSRVAETLASAVSIALTPHLDQLKLAGLVRIGLRVTLEPERVGYEVGSNGERLPDFYMNDLDSALIPVIHGAITQSREGPIVLELILHVIH